jgi:predicted transcriptional regulator
VEYKFPNTITNVSLVHLIDFSLELCSEAPLYRLDWPSDITLWINGVEIGLWTSPSDFGGVRGILTPHWWGDHNTQYGVYKTWSVMNDASYIDGKKISNVTLKDVLKKPSPCFTVRIGVKKGAANDGGVNIFGKKFGNYETETGRNKTCLVSARKHRLFKRYMGAGTSFCYGRLVYLCGLRRRA